jgi:hypothetical protein
LHDEDEQAKLQEDECQKIGFSVRRLPVLIVKPNNVLWDVQEECDYSHDLGVHKGPEPFGVIVCVQEHKNKKCRKENVCVERGHDF